MLASKRLLRALGPRKAAVALKRMTPEEIREKAGLLTTTPIPSPPAPPVAPAVAPAPSPLPAEPRVALGEDWSRVALLPGLELHVRGDAKDFVRRVAREIREKYASG